MSRRVLAMGALFTLLARTPLAEPSFGQTAPSRDVAAAVSDERSGTVILRGRVVRADTRQPLRRVTVLVTSRGGSRVALVSSDADGRFEVRDVSPGEYILRASRNGFAPMDYGQRRPFELPQSVTVGKGALADPVEFVMTPAAAITGQVTDENSEPITGASVTVGRIRYVNKSRTLVLVGRSRPTDDLGTFRVGNLPAGDYILRVAPRIELSTEIEQEYAPTYYPGTSSIGNATPIRLTSGQEVSGIVLPVGTALTALLNGTVSGVEPDASVTVTLRAAEFGGLDTQNVVTRNGRFRFSSVPPGEYLLEASRTTASGVERSIATVTMSGTDTTVTMPFRAPVWLRGRIRLDAAAPTTSVAPGGMAVVINSMIGDHTVTAEARVREDGTFEARAIHGWPATIHARTPAGWALSRVTLRDADIGETPVLENNLDGIDLVLTNRVGQVTGTVHDPAGTRVTDAAIVLAADPRARTAPPRLVRTTRLDRRGVFTIPDLPHGDYILVALEHLEDGIEADPEWLAQTLRLNTLVSVPGQTASPLELRLARER